MPGDEELLEEDASSLAVYAELLGEGVGASLILGCFRTLQTYIQGQGWRIMPNIYSSIYIYIYLLYILSRCIIHSIGRPARLMFFPAAEASASNTKRCYSQMTDGAFLEKEGATTKGLRPRVVHAERDCHAFFSRLGLSIPVPLQKHTYVVPDGAGVIESDYIRPRDWVGFLLDACPYLLAGGSDPLEQQLKSFWSLYEWSHSSHAVFGQDRSRLERTLPISLFSDEGKGPKRGNYVVTTFESPIGLYEHESAPCNCKDFVMRHVDHVPTCYGAVDRSDTSGLQVASLMGTNMQGHTYLTRHILFGLADVVYKDYKEVYDELIGVVSEDFKSLFLNGLQVAGKTFFCAIIGCKENLKHMAEKWEVLDRSYAHLGRTRELGMCSLCLAGLPGTP